MNYEVRVVEKASGVTTYVTVFEPTIPTHFNAISESIDCYITTLIPNLDYECEATDLITGLSISVPMRLRS